ncbi:MAG TPA: polysaccharide deacetylase family protein [Candidatus Limnocylindrales bacterium]|nr:polysaccharide deacetylase family protein [Candidatus Limnocylindrales bacterium]
MAFRIALTFDAEHPDRSAASGNAERLLASLDRLALRATFFVQGRWAEACPATARRIFEAGHLIGSHSHYHAPMPLLSDEGLADDLESARAAILEHTGADPRPWFRCPFGAGGEDRGLIARVERLGYREVGWDVNPEDWQPTNSDVDVEDAVVSGVLARGDGAVVLLHTWPDQTSTALPRIVDALRRRGADFIAVDELARLPTTHPG